MKFPGEEYHRGQRFPFYVLLQELKVIAPEEVALSYSASVLSLPKRSLLSYNGDPDAVDFFKKKFQEDTRVGLYLLAQHLNVGRKEFTQLRADFEGQIDQALEALREGNLPVTERSRGKTYLHFQEGTIEKVLATQLEVDSSNLTKIYSALEKGAENFRVYVSKNGRDHRSLEYNTILRALKEI